MEFLIAIAVGGLYAAAIYSLLRRSLVKLIIGLALLSNAVNLLVFSAAGLTRGNAPIVPEGAEAPTPPFADPLPQAMILTAIVIGFGVLAFTVVLVLKSYQVLRSDDLDQLRSKQ
jgi:multicomponent Na+:H+ antiporter subunit C